MFIFSYESLEIFVFVVYLPSVWYSKGSLDRAGFLPEGGCYGLLSHYI